MADSTVDICPTINKDQVADILKNDYGFINGKIQELDGYDDKNYYITDVEKYTEEIEFPIDGIVVKFINSIDSKNLLLLDAQTKLTQHLERSGIYCPIPVFNKYGESYRSHILDNKIHAVRVYKYVKGETMNKVKINSEMTANFGFYVGRLTSILKTFNHDGFHRSHLWALEKCPEVLKFVEVFDQEKQQQTITTVINKFQSDVLLKADYLEKSVIHEDLNMNNIIIKDNKILGIIDVGDVVHSFTIFDFSVALCYLIMHEFKDNNAKLSNVHIKNFVEAYEKQYRNLNDFEVSIIHTCICARICQSLVLGKKSSLRDLSNSYILSTQKNGWRALEELMNIEDDKFVMLLKH
ncbi:hydroxylysine kinase [Metopolophium dirhodum]|uniref:hydroxylysine kinase n=1 Tax=Metopolophium dirhodum TaxID=44670 RepID=UPI002990263A|nr:hydroxylysine kinase [Metopolophium dirhodum]XP_060878488.1 hydroxylysine kinase [Metopolophium dirhodum]XP_060878489.1 hydroxylysine kinase [Metopolophium dirhodum]XP_060878490.1 hydroxylysine kinase [Metopolophium dirhodum]